MKKKTAAFDWYEDHVGEDGPDHERAEAWLDRALELFEHAPEARELAADQATWLDVVQSLGLNYLGVSLGRMEVADLDELLFIWVPRKVSMHPAEGRDLLAELRAFYSWAARELGVPEAAECAEWLSPEVERELERRLGDPSLFGMAKSFIMGGERAGLDMSTEEGVQAWAMAQNLAARDRLLDRPSRAAPTAKKNTARAKAKKKKRKTAKKSRRKNR